MFKGLWLASDDCCICQKKMGGKKIVCSECRSIIEHHQQHNPYFDDGFRIYSVAPYQGAFRDAHLRFKYRGQTWLARYFASLMVQTYLSHLENAGCKATLVTSVPSVRCRMGQRGYNTSALLATHFSRQTGIKQVDLLKRKASAKQTGLSRERRMINIHKKMSPLGEEKKLYAGVDDHLLLVDDVSTTGATLYEGVRALRTMGCQKISCLCFLKD